MLMLLKRQPYQLKNHIKNTLGTPSRNNIILRVASVSSTSTSSDSCKSTCALITLKHHERTNHNISLLNGPSPHSTSSDICSNSCVSSSSSFVVPTTMFVLFRHPDIDFDSICESLGKSMSFDVFLSDQNQKQVMSYLDHTNVMYIGTTGYYHLYPGNNNNKPGIDSDDNMAEQKNAASLMLKYGITYRLPDRIRAHKKRFGPKFSPLLFFICDCNRQVESRVKHLANTLSRSCVIKSSTEIMAIDPCPSIGPQDMSYGSSPTTTANYNEVDHYSGLVTEYGFCHFLKDMLDIVDQESEMLASKKTAAYHLLKTNQNVHKQGN